MKMLMMPFNRSLLQSLKAHVKLSAGILALAATAASAGPIDITLQPSPQGWTNSCQSYSMALAMLFNPSSPFQANTPAELRDLESRLRQAIQTSAGKTPPTHQDWQAAMLNVSGNALKLVENSYSDLDTAMRFVAQKTGISSPIELGSTLSIGLIQTPVLMSFLKIDQSNYPEGHVVTVFGVELPQQTMGNSASPAMLLVNSAVKYADSIKNVCQETDLSDSDRYTAIVTLTDQYQLKNYQDPTNPIFLVDYVDSNN